MNEHHFFSRRQFLGSALAAGASATLSAVAADAPAGEAKPKEFARKIKLGLIGCGGRGSWLGDLFTKHGGYQVCAVADYFPERAEKAGDKFGVDKARRFSGLSAHKRLLESGVEAVTVVNGPHFHPDHARAAIEAGSHVFAAKPVAVDVPGALKVQAAGKLATQKKLCYLVDYQMWTDPINIEVVKRIHEGGLGKLGHIDSVGFSMPWGEPPIKTVEDRLRWWLPTTALSGDVINELSIHSINAVLWVVGKRPASAIGRTRVCRANPRTEFREIYLVTYEFDDGLLWSHRVQSLRNDLDWALKLDAYGDKATALVSYRG
ncbi:MAG: Gfo/Idh/MocA family oxidoreductase, partial [Verrucomicrobiia bacterium]